MKPENQFNHDMLEISLDNARKCEHDNDLVNTLRFFMSKAKNPDVFDNSLKIAKLLHDMGIVIDND